MLIELESLYPAFEFSVGQKKISLSMYDKVWLQIKSK